MFIYVQDPPKIVDAQRSESATEHQSETYFGYRIGEPDPGRVKVKVLRLGASKKNNIFDKRTK